MNGKVKKMKLMVCEFHHLIQLYTHTHRPYPRSQHQCVTLADPGSSSRPVVSDGSGLLPGG